MTDTPGFIDRAARPAPMAEEVKALLAEAASDKWIFTGSLALDNLVARLAACVERQSAHIDHLTRKVTEAEGLLREIHEQRDSLGGIWASRFRWVERRDAFLAGQPISRPQQTDAVLDAAKAVVWFDWSDNDSDAVAAIDALRAAVRRARPSPGPATETERKDEAVTDFEREILEEIAGQRLPRTWGAAVGAAIGFLQGSGHLTRGTHVQLTDKGRALLASVRPKEEGV